MYKIILKIFMLTLLPIGVTFAQMTTILAPLNNYVQCNHWGWVTGSKDWPNVCTPLEVRSFDGTVYSIENTQRCGEKESAVYFYQEGATEIGFWKCYKLKDESTK